MRQYRLRKFCCGYDWNPRPGLIFSIMGVGADKKKANAIADQLNRLRFDKRLKGHFNASPKRLANPEYKQNIEARIKDEH